MTTTQCHIAGVPYAKPDLSQIHADTIVDLVPEPENHFDSNAVRVEYAGIKLGYIPKVMTQFVQGKTTATVVGIDPANKWHEVTIEF